MSTSGAIRAGKAFVELFADDSKLVRTLRHAENHIRKFGASIRAIGRKISAIGLAASTPFAVSMKVFSSFDDEMRAVKAVTQATGEEFDMLTAKAKLLGRTTSFTTAQVAAGMVELGRAGFSPKEIDSAIAGMLDLARATGTDLATATEIAGNTLRRFNLDASEMARMSDVLTATANLSAQTLVDLGESLKDSGPLASAYGMTLEELCKTLGALANFGIKGSMAGTTMKNIMTRLADPSIQAQFKSLGVQVSRLGKLRNVADILSDVGAAVDDLPTDKKLAIFKELFGLRAIAGGAKLTVAEFQRLNEGIDTAAGRAQSTAKEMDAGIGGSFRMLWSAVEGVAIAVGEALAPALQKMTDYWTAACSGLVDYLTKNKQIVVYAAKVVAAVTGIGLGLMALSATIIGVGKTIGIIATSIATLAKFALFGFSMISGAISLVTMTIGTVVSAFSGMATMIGAVFGGIAAAVGTAFSVLATVGTTAFGIIGTVIAAAFSPLGLVVIAIGAVAGACFLVYRNASAIGNTISNVFQSIVGVVANAATAVYAFLNRFTEFKIIFGVINLVRGGLQLLGKTVLWLANSVVKPAFSIIFGIFRQLAGVAVTVATSVGSAILSGLGDVIGIVSAVFRSLASVVASIIGKIVSVVGSVFSGIASVIVRVLSPVLSIIGAVFQGILRFISPIGTALRTVTGWIVSFARSFFVVESAIQVFSFLSTAIRGAVGLFSNLAGAAISTIFSIAKAVPAVVSSIVRFFFTLPGQILSVFSQIPRIVGGAFAKVVGTAKTVVSGIGAVFSNVANIAANAWSGLVKAVSYSIQFCFEGARAAGSLMRSSCKLVGAAVDWLRQQFANLCNFATETFSAIAATLGRGDIESALQVVWASLKLIWIKGSTWLLSTWYWVVDSLQTAWASCVYKLSEILTSVWYGVQEFWAETVYTMSTLWTEFSSGVVSAWKSAEKAVAKGIGYLIAKVEGLDYSELSKTIDEDYNRQSQQREAEKSQALTGIQKRRDEKMASLKSEKDGTLDILKSDFARNAGTRDAAYHAKLAAQEQELSRAQAAYDESIQRAKNPEIPQGEEQTSVFESVKQQVQKVMRGFKPSTDLESKISVSGTFSSAAARGLGGGTVMERVARQTERTARATEEIARNSKKEVVVKVEQPPVKPKDTAVHDNRNMPVFT